MPTILDEFSLPKAETFNKVEFEPSVDQGLGESILKILKSFNIEGKIVGTETGPIVTSVYFAPASGVRVSSVEERADDLQIRLGVASLKISMAAEKRAVAIEIPNTKPCKIQFGNVFHSDCSHMQLPAALGVDTKGNSVYLDITKTPHMLIAGQTGSGKSVCLNSIIVSLALNCRPADLQFLLIDPKCVEFFPYEKMQNLVSGHVIKDVDEALQSLMWLVQEMEARNVILEKCRCRNIKDFKRKLNLGQIEDMPIPFTQDMPYIVAVVDEYADLMMRSPKELVDCIMKLAQKARNVGIHLILATQRPSTKIISGDIKANIPARIALKTATAVDSSTILGFGGAEKLLGKGDMLLSTDGPVKRIHGCYISDEEIEKAISLLPTRDMFHFNRKDLFLTDFELFWNERFKERPTWGEINAVSKAALEHINDYLNNKEIEVNQGIAKEELANIWQELEKAVKNEELCKLITKRFLPQMPITESEFTKLVIYTNFYFKDSEANHPFMKFILEKAVKESDKTALMTVKHFSSSACYDRNILQKEIKTMCDNNEMSKEFIYEHFADFKSVIVDWAKEGDERALKIIYKKYADVSEFRDYMVKTAENGDSVNKNIIFNNCYYFKDAIIKWAESDNEKKAKEVIFNRPDRFIDAIVRMADNGDEDALGLVDEIFWNPYDYKDALINLANCENEKASKKLHDLFLNMRGDSDLKEALIYASDHGNKWAQKFIFEHSLDFKEKILKWVDRKKIEAIDFIYNHPSDFKEVVINWCLNNNDERAKEAIHQNSHFFKDLITEWANDKNDEKAKESIFQNFKHFRNVIIDWAINKNDERAKEIICYNFNDFCLEHFECDKLENYIISWANNGNQKAKKLIYNRPARFENVVIDWANNKNDERAKEGIYQDPYNFKDVIADWAVNKNDEKAKNTVYKHPYNFKKIIIDWAINKNDVNAIEAIFENFESFEDIIIKWASSGGERAKEIIYNNPYDFENTLFDWASDNNNYAQKILTNLASDNNNCAQKILTNFYHDDKNIFIEQASCRDNRWAIDFICTNISDFKEKIINKITEVDQNIRENFYAKEDVPDYFSPKFLEAIFQINSKDAFEIKKSIAESNVFRIYLDNCNYWVNYDPSAIKDFLLYDYWPSNKDCADACANFVESLALGHDKDAQHAIIEDLYEDCDKQNPYYDFVIQHDSLSWCHDFICEWWYGELETIFLKWVRDGDDLARERFFYKLSDNISNINEYGNLTEKDNLRKTIKALAIEGYKDAQNVIFENYESFEDDDINDHVIEWANNGDERARKIIYNHPDDFQSVLIDWTNDNDEKAREIIIEFINKSGCDNDNAKRFVYDHPNEFKNLIIDWACNWDDEAEKFIYDNYTIFSNTIIEWANNGNERAKNIAFKFLIDHGCDNEYEKHFIYDHPNEFKETIIEWANDGDEEAKKFIYNHPDNFKETIVDWANSGDDWAKKIAFIFTNDSGYDNVFSEHFVYNHPNEFKDLIIDWANNNDEDASNFTYCDPDIFSDFIIEKATSGDEEAIDFIYGNFAVFNETITKWANDGDERAKKEIAAEEERKNFVKEVVEMIEKEDRIKEANSGNNEAKKIIFNDPYGYKDIIAKWAKEGDSEAADIVKNNPEIFQ